jgi:hypothetical protein
MAEFAAFVRAPGLPRQDQEDSRRDDGGSQLGRTLTRSGPMSASVRKRPSRRTGAKMCDVPIGDIHVRGSAVRRMSQQWLLAELLGFRN